jgi:hypothetical protein
MCGVKAGKAAANRCVEVGCLDGIERNAADGLAAGFR